MFNEIKDKILKNFELTEKDVALLDEILVEENLEKLSTIIDVMISYFIQPDFLMAYLVYNYSKTNALEAQKITKEFSVEQKKLFKTFTLLRDVTTLNRADSAEDFRKLFLAICQDMRVVVVKFASILYDLNRISILTNEQDKEFVTMIREIFAPLAERLGLNMFKNAFEDKCFELLEPEAFNTLKNEVLLNKNVNKKQMDLTTKKLKQILHELKIEGEIQCRQKHFYSVYKKLKAKNVTLGRVYDLVAMRVIVDTIEDCYAVLGKIHAIYKPIQGRVKDYIANSKPNGYQSLHTTIVADNTHPLEIQIRTHDMHKRCEYGVAAHWIYKEKRTQNKLDKRLTWFRQMLESSRDLDDERFLETLKADLYGESILVQTPKGKVLEFPLGATVLDFAYSIHSDVGNKCVGARINGKMVPITSKLNNADVVEIITNPNSKGPSRDWLKFVVTSSAKQRIRTFFKSIHKEENIKNGKLIFDQALKARNLQLSKENKEEYLLKIAKSMMFESIDVLFAEIGAGSISVNSIVGRIVNLFKNDSKAVTSDVINIKQNEEGVLVDGDVGVLVTYAKCCNPVIGDEIVGYISRGRGVTIHRAGCTNLRYLEPERFIHVEWQKDFSSLFVTTIKVETENDSKMIATLSDFTREMKGKVKGFGYVELQDKLQFKIILQIKSKQELENIIKKLKAKKQVVNVYRSD